MSRIASSNEGFSSEMQKVAEQVRSILGFVPNSLLLLNFNPALAQTVASLSAIIMSDSEDGISAELKSLVALIVSSAAGCEYCKSHTRYSAKKKGIATNKIANIWEYQTNELFSEAERAALTVAKGSAFAPNTVTDDDFVEIKKHFSTNQILEIVSVISLFGFLNRWNGTLLTDIEKVI